MTTASRALAQTSSPFDPERIRLDFPALNQEVNGHPLVFLDSAASAHKPQAVIDAVVQVYSKDYSNIHRGVHTLSQRATDAYEKARLKAQRFLGARSEKEIIFVRGTTEAINLVAHTYGRRLREGDEILVSTMEHHSNIVPWQLLAEATGARVVEAPITDRGELNMDAFRGLLGGNTRIVAIGHVSNALGTINPVKEVIAAAHEVGAVVVVDGAQAAPHLKIDVAELDVDFYAISSHKMFGPSGVGVLYGKRALLEAMPPYQGGGDMILTVSFEETSYNELPHKFEAGTPNIAGVIGFGAAIDYLERIGLDAIACYEHELLEYGTARLLEVGGLRMIGEAHDKASVLSFVLDGVHPHDIGTILDQEGIAVRTGHHCAQPVMDRFGVAATTRASLAMYNTRDDIDRLVAALQKVREIFL